jgi:hypothetical protein
LSQRSIVGEATRDLEEYSRPYLVICLGRSSNLSAFFFRFKAAHTKNYSHRDFFLFLQDISFPFNAQKTNIPKTSVGEKSRPLPSTSFSIIFDDVGGWINWMLRMENVFEEGEEAKALVLFNLFSNRNLSSNVHIILTKRSEPFSMT